MRLTVQVELSDQTKAWVAHAIQKAKEEIVADIDDLETKFQEVVTAVNASYDRLSKKIEALSAGANDPAKVAQLASEMQAEIDKATSEMPDVPPAPAP
jgi:ABC-type hemin transport system substrate-binding protein